MHTKKTWVPFLFLILFIGCSTGSRFTQGMVNPAEFYTKTTFDPARSLVVLTCELDGVSKNFIFDTGAQVSAIQRDSISGDIVTVRGGSNRTVENGTETVKSLMIGEVEFVNTFATNENMVYLKEEIPNYGGVLGRTIIDKANWLIDYPNRTVELSNRELSDESYTDIPLTKSSDTPYTYVEIDNKRHRSIIDLGSISIFNVPDSTELAKELLNSYEFVEISRERYTVGGVQTITEQIGTIPSLKIGATEFRNVTVNINQSSQIRLGIRFFKDYMIYIDNLNRRFRIKATSSGPVQTDG
jgi:hypothetical protein